MKIRNERLAAVAVGAAIVVGLGSVTAYAAGQITSEDIKNRTIQTVDLARETRQDLRGNEGPQGPQGPQGPKGDSELSDAYYATAYYDVGDTNAGAIATVACSNQTDTAISGGVQVLGLDDGANSRNTPVSSSFPGRMDWSTGAPKADRLDGWIVQFGGNAQSPDSGDSSDKAPLKTKIWALCVPDATIPVVQTYTESD